MKLTLLEIHSNVYMDQHAKSHTSNVETQLFGGNLRVHGRPTISIDSSPSPTEAHLQYPSFSESRLRSPSSHSAASAKQQTSRFHRHACCCVYRLTLTLFAWTETSLPWNYMFLVKCFLKPHSKILSSRPPHLTPCRYTGIEFVANLTLISLAGVKWNLFYVRGRDNLSTKDNIFVPIVPLVWRFHCNQSPL